MFPRVLQFEWLQKPVTVYSTQFCNFLIVRLLEEYQMAVGTCTRNCHYGYYGITAAAMDTLMSVCDSVGWVLNCLYRTYLEGQGDLVSRLITPTSHKYNYPIYPHY